MLYVIGCVWDVTFNSSLKDTYITVVDEEDTVLELSIPH